MEIYLIRVVINNSVSVELVDWCLASTWNLKLNGGSKMAIIVETVEVEENLLNIIKEAPTTSNRNIWNKYYE